MKLARRCHVSIKVLVVDDEPPIRKLLRMGLSAQGYDVIDAPNGKTASSCSPRNRISSSSISACPTFTDSICWR